MRLAETFDIDGIRIGAGHPAFIIAEISANHGQDLERAQRLVEEAKKAGADAVKLQTYTADTITLDCDRPEFFVEGTIWNGQRLYELYESAHTPWEWHPQLKNIADQLGMPLFSSPFDKSAVEFLETLNVPAYKIASFELIDIPLLRQVGSTGKPVILSTGMAALSEIREAVQTLYQAGTSEIALLKCTSAYPAPPESMNLRTISSLIQEFSCPCGLSDHSMSHDAAIASVCLGGSIIEKHLTLQRSDGGPDAAFSLEPSEFSEMVQRVRAVERVLGNTCFGPSKSDVGNLKFRRSLYVVQDIQKGDAFNVGNVRSIRPANGLAPKHWNDVIGRTATKPISKGTPLEWEHIA